MSHHLDSPSSRQDARLNLTDLYVFNGKTGTVLVMNLNTSLAGEGRTPGFHPEARYEWRVHPDDADYEDLTYRVTFGERDAGGSQTVVLHQLTGADARGDDGIGVQVADGVTGAVIDGSGGVRLWAGTAADPFYLDLAQLSPVVKGLQTRTPIVFDDWTVEKAASTFSGSRVASIVLEVPASDAQLRAGRDIGVWSVAKLATDAGGWHQVNRAAIPMVWPLLRAIGDSDDDPDYRTDTASHPSDDRANDGNRVVDMITAAARSTGTRDPGAYGASVAQLLLPDLLPYTVGTPASFGFGGFNGRTLADNAPEVMFSLVTNTGFPTGLRPADAAETRSDEFPYVVPARDA